MMPLLRRANDTQASEWNPVPEGVWRFHLGAPEVQFNDRWNAYQARFPLELTTAEQDRLIEEFGRPPEGVQQSFRVPAYTAGLSLGFFQKDGQYKSTKLIDFLSACLGRANEKRFREWIQKGGGPLPADDPDDPEQEIAAIGEWLRWWEDLELYGSVRHEEDKNVAGVIWARFGGPMAIGSMPGQKEEHYQSIGLGKLRGMIAESEGAETQASKPAAAKITVTRTAADRPPARRYTADGEEAPF